MRSYAQFIATRMYIHLMCAYVYFISNAHFKYIKVQRYDLKQHHALKALSYGAIFLATCNAILFLRDAN